MLKNNVAALLKEAAARSPDKVAVHTPSGRRAGGAPGYETRTFRELDEESDRLADGLKRLGLARGARTLLMVPPGFEFMAVSFALFKIGAPPVLIDPGMGKANLLSCVAQAGPEAMIAVPKAHLARRLWPRYFRSVKHFVTVGGRWPWGGVSLKDVREASADRFEIAETAPDDVAAVLFTTGSTGAPKGVVYEHGIFAAQVRMIREHYGVGDDDVDMPAFPLFALFSAAMGMSVVVPDMDPTRPGRVEPARIVEAINGRSVTFTFGSPAMWKRVSEYCYEKDVRLPTLRKVLMAGAPVPDLIHRRLLNGVLPPEGQTHTPFGATESLPVCDITGREVIDETWERTKKGEGVCVGRPLQGMRVEIIRITDEVIPEWDESLALPRGEIGEIVVCGPVVTREYHGLPEQTKLAKIRNHKDGAVWHRMGDVGYFDEQGRLWFLGRKGHRVITPLQTLYTIQCEAIFNRHPDVSRSALVGLGDPPDQTPAIVIEIEKNRPGVDRAALKRELLMFAEANPFTESIRTILFHPEFPTDVRHNAKIFREKLKTWAEKRAK